MNKEKFKLDWLILPLIGIGVVMLIWAVSSATWAKELPSPLKTWEKSREYVLKPFEKRGEMDQVSCQPCAVRSTEIASS